MNRGRPGSKASVSGRNCRAVGLRERRQAAITAFGAEKGENAGHEQACASLRTHFSTADSPAAHRCAAFCFGEQQRGEIAGKAATMRQDLATFAQFRLDA